MKTNYRIRLTQRLAVLTSIMGLGTLLCVPAMAKPAVKGAGSSAGMAHTKQDASPTTTPNTGATPTTTPDTGATPSPTPSTGATPTTTPGNRTAPTTNPGTRTAPTTTPGNRTAPTNGGTGSSSQNVVQVASGNSSFSTLVQAVTAAGLANRLSGRGPFTIFAPTDQAFAALPQGAVELLLKPENKRLLQQLLTYHVVPGKLTANRIKTGKLDALGGGLAVEVQGNKVIVNNASVTQANIQASNGVIHAIDRVLMPRELRQTIVSKLKGR